MKTADTTWPSWARTMYRSRVDANQKQFHMTERQATDEAHRHVVKEIEQRRQSEAMDRDQLPMFPGAKLPKIEHRRMEVSHVK